MIVLAALMLRRRGGEDAADAPLTWQRAGKLAAVGLGVGVLAGFFGIGGGFLIVPGLVLATGMPMIAAVGTSLISVFRFGLTTAANYALSGLVVWSVAGLFVLGGLGGGVAGSHLAQRLSTRRNALNHVFAAIIVVVALYTSRPIRRLIRG